MTFRLAAAAVAWLVAGAAALAQTPPTPGSSSMPMHHGQHMQGAPPAAGGPHAQHGAPARADSPATREYKAANAKMHKDMAIRFTNDADKDFAAAMIPHHQGAIDMARTVAKHGKDPELRRLAEDIIAAQEREIVQLRAILARLK